MAVYREEHSDPLKICPYNSNHRIAARRYQIHVDACGKMQGNDWAICPYNSTHRVLRSELAKHKEECGQSIPMLREAQQVAVMKAGAGTSSFKPLPIIGLSNPHTASDPWAEEGERDGVKKFTIKGLGKDFDVDDFINNHPDPTKQVDNICLQRLTPSQRTIFFENRRKAANKLRADKEREEREKNKRPNEGPGLSGNQEEDSMEDIVFESDNDPKTGSTMGQWMASNRHEPIPMDDAGDWEEVPAAPVRLPQYEKPVDPRIRGAGRGANRK